MLYVAHASSCASTCIVTFKLWVSKNSAAYEVAEAENSLGCFAYASTALFYFIAISMYKRLLFTIPSHCPHQNSFVKTASL